MKLTILITVSLKSIYNLFTSIKPYAIDWQGLVYGTFCPPLLSVPAAVCVLLVDYPEVPAAAAALLLPTLPPSSTLVLLLPYVVRVVR